MNIKIVSDGKTTRLVEADSGQAIGLVQKVTWTADANEVGCRAILEVVNVPAVLYGEAEIIEQKPTEKQLHNLLNILRGLDEDSLQYLIAALKADAKRG